MDRVLVCLCKQWQVARIRQGAKLAKKHLFIAVSDHVLRHSNVPDVMTKLESYYAVAQKVGGIDLNCTVFFGSDGESDADKCRKSLCRIKDHVDAVVSDSVEETKCQHCERQSPAPLHVVAETESPPSSSSSISSSPYCQAQFGHTAVGGTFDRLHQGHKLLLSAAILVTTKTGKITIGITGPEMLKKKKFANLLEPLEARKEAVREFIRVFGGDEVDVLFVELKDSMGPTATDATIEALVVSDETVAGVTEINRIRVEKEMKPMEVFSINLLSADGESEKISSSALRERDAKRRKQNNTQ